MFGVVIKKDFKTISIVIGQVQAKVSEHIHKCKEVYYTFIVFKMFSALLYLDNLL